MKNPHMIIPKEESWMQRTTTGILMTFAMRPFSRNSRVLFAIAASLGFLFSSFNIHADGNILYWNKTFSDRYDLAYNWWVTPEGPDYAAAPPNGADAVAAFLLGGNSPATFWTINFNFIAPEVDHFHFGQDAGYYEMSVGSSSLTFSGQGIVNESGKYQGISVGNNGYVLFQNNASAGLSRLVATGSGKIIFRDNATASDAIVQGHLDFSGINDSSFKVGTYLGGQVTMGSKHFILDGLSQGESLSIYGFFTGTDPALLIQRDHGTRTITQSSTQFGGIQVDSGTLILDGGNHSWTAYAYPLNITGGEMTISGGATVSISGGVAQVRGENGAAAGLTITGNGTTVSGASFFIVGTSFYGDQHLAVGQGAILSADNFFVGYYGSGAAVIDRGRINASSVAIGTGSSTADEGALEIKGAVGQEGRLVVTYDLDVGGRPWEISGSGYLLASSRTSISAGNVNIGRPAGGVGEIELRGVSAQLNVSNEVNVGYAGKGTLTVADSATASISGSLSIARESGSEGIVNVIGSGSSLESPGVMSVGVRGKGQLRIEDGGTVTSTIAGTTVSIGWNSGSEGSVTVDGGTLRIQNTFLGVGYQGGKGSLTLSGGGTAALGGIVIGYFAGSTGNAMVTGNGSQMNVSSVAYIGYDVNTKGELNVQSGGTVYVSDWIELGTWGMGELIVGDGGTLSIGNGTQWIYAASSAGASASVTVGGKSGTPAVGSGKLNIGGIAFGAGNGELRFNHSDASYAFVNSAAIPIPIQGYVNLFHEGSGTTVFSSNTIQVGNIQVDLGALVFDGATATVSGNMVAGSSSASDGQIAIRGSGTTLGYAGGMGIGYQGEGRLIVEDGAMLTSTVAGKESGIGVISGSRGEVKVEGGIINIAQGALAIGVAGEGLLEVSDGGQVLLGLAAVGYEPGGVGELVLSNGGLLTLASGQGTLNIGVASGSSGSICIGGKAGEEATASGVLNVAKVAGGSGQGELHFNHSDTFYAFTNSNGSGIEIVGNVSVIHDGPGTTLLSGSNSYTGGTWLRNGLLQIADGSATQNDLIHFEGGAIEWLGERPVLGGIAGSGDFDFGVAPLRLNQSADTVFSGTLSGEGDLIKDGVGTLTIAGVMDYTGRTVVNGGTVEVTQGILSDGAEVVIGVNGILISGGEIIRDIRNDGVLESSGEVPLHLSSTVSGTGAFSGDFHLSGTTRPGASPGLMLFEGDLSFAEEHILEMEIGGLIRGEGYDALDITGSFTTAGTLVVAFLNDFQPEDGDIFVLFYVGGAINGMFDAVLLPELDPSLGWDTSNLYVNGTISVVPEPRVYALLLGLVSMSVLYLRRSRRV